MKSLMSRLCTNPTHRSSGLSIKMLCALLAGLLMLPLAAQSETSKPLISDGKPKKHYRLSELTWMDKRHLARQSEKISDLTSIKLGQPVRGTLDDIGLLQRVIYKGLIKKEDAMSQQAMGAVLGDLMAKEFELQWMVFEDGHGRSRAVCEPISKECLFPITMLSRRMNVGLLPNVRELYDYSYELIEPHLPKKPYTH